MNYIYFWAILRYKNHERYQRINLLHLWHGQETPCLLYIFQVYIIRQKRKLNTMLCEGNPSLFLRDGSNTICRIRWMSLETLSLESATLRSMKVSLNLHPHTKTSTFSQSSLSNRKGSEGDYLWRKWLYPERQRRLLNAYNEYSLPYQAICWSTFFLSSLESFLRRLPITTR